MRRILSAAAVLAAVAAMASPGAGSRRVVLIVWDGMRPDFIDAGNTPNLCSLIQRGVYFERHHPVYPSATDVNGTAIVTGAYPGHSTIVANMDYRPAINADKPVGIEQPAVVRKGDEVTGGRHLAVATLAEFLHSQRLRTAIAGAKDVSLLADRAPRGEGGGSSPVLAAGTAMPAGTEAALTAALGAFPPVGKNDEGKDNKLERDNWTTRGFLEVLWKDGIPAYSLLWMAEPDASQHPSSPGSPAAIKAIRNNDANLGCVLAELERRGLRDDTDVIIASDHGFSSISRAVDVAARLSAAGFHAVRRVDGGLKSGDVLVIPNGGSTVIYVGGRDPAVSARVAAWLQEQDWTGVIFSRAPFAGTFPLGVIHIDSPDAPDFTVSFRWTPEANPFGAPGMVCIDGKDRGPGGGAHASLSVSDMHNILIAAGPDFRVGMHDSTASGNVDLTPTILWVLGFKDEALRRDGRVLGEALTGEAPPLKSSESKHLTARREIAPGRVWEQYLDMAEVNGVQYFDEGNGSVKSAR